MEATNDGLLVRQYHTGFESVRILSLDGSKYSIQRVAKANPEHANGINVTKIICHSPFVSKFHCEIFRKNRAFWIKDPLSTNRTFLNGVELHKNDVRELRFEDMIGAGVSHTESGGSIDVTDPDYFIFKFVKADQEVISLDEDETEVEAQDNTGKDNDPAAVRREEKDDDDIEVVAEVTGNGLNLTSTSESNSDEGRNCQALSKRKPPPNSKDNTTVPSSSKCKEFPGTSAAGGKKQVIKEGGKECSDSIDAKKASVQKLHHPGSKLQVAQSSNAKPIDDSSLRSVHDIGNVVSRKRLKLDKKTSSSSSDDSSDGLGDFENPSSNHQRSHSYLAKAKFPNSGKIIHSSESGDDDSVNSNMKTSSSRKRKLSSESDDDLFVTVGITKSKPTARKKTCVTPPEYKKKNKSKETASLYNALKAEAVKSKCRVKLQNVFRSKHGRYKLVDNLVYLSDKTKALVKRQFEASHRRTQCSAGSNTERNSDLYKESPKSESEDEDLLGDSVTHSPCYNSGLTEMEFEASVEEPLSRSSISTLKDKQEFKESSLVGTIKSTQFQRAVQLLDNPPPPRSAIKAQAKNGFRVPPPPPKLSEFKEHFKMDGIGTPKTKSLGFPMSREEQRHERIQKLRELELKKQQEKEANSPASTVKKPAATAKVKMTRRNRNQELMEDIVGEKFKDTDSAVGETVLPSTSFISRVMLAKNISSDSDSKDLPEHAASEEGLRDPRLTKFAYPEHTARIHGIGKSNAINIAVPVPGSSKLPPQPTYTDVSISRREQDANNRSKILKPGAEVILSPPFKNTIAYKEEPAISSKAKLLKKREQIELAVPWCDIYKRALRWNPKWLQEQRLAGMSKAKKEPPLYEEGHNYTSTLTTYASFDAYFNTYYPLFLSEMWAVIANDSDKKNENSVARSNYQIKIDSIKRSKEFPPGSSRPGLNEEMVHISYHTWVKNRSDIDSKKDFMVLTVSGKEDASGTKTERQLFCYSHFTTIKCDPVSKVTDCDSRLIQKGAKIGGYRFSEVISCKTTFSIDKDSLARINRLCYVMPKIREFRALNDLKSSKLFDQIVSPCANKNTWNPGVGSNFNGRPHNLIRLCYQLNSDQLAMVVHISRRVFSDKHELMLMHGPPGTGKTATIVAVVLQLLVESFKRNPKGNNRILICTPSNAAVDEVLRRLATAKESLPNTLNAGKGISIIRVGDNCSKDVEQFTVAARAQAVDDKKTTVLSIKTELTAIDNEIEEKTHEIELLKKSENPNPTQIQAKTTTLDELIERKLKLSLELNETTEKKQSKNISESMKIRVLSEANIVCSTLSSIGNSLVRNTFLRKEISGSQPFLCCIVDEASQTTEPETLIPLSLEVTKLLLVGDPHQLGATVKSNLAENKGYGQSLFSRLHKFHERNSPDSVMKLRRQYRMHPDIVMWPNIFFYDGDLETHHKTPNASFTLRPYYFFSLQSSREQCGKDGLIENQDEVKMVEILLDTMEENLHRSKLQWTVGVITPYAAQKEGIKRTLQNKTFRSFPSVQVDTVDGFQGQERDVIIFSCVRTDATGFLKTKNRLNVALTRARHSLYIIGDVRCLSENEMWRCLIQDAAERNCKYDVNPDFKMDLKFTKSQIGLKLTERLIK